MTSLAQLPSPSFVPTCPKTGGIGLNCTIPDTPCDMLKPCKNNGACNNTDDNQSYKCLCAPGFNGTYCEHNQQPCQPNPCWNNGIHTLLFLLIKNNDILFYRHM